VATVTADPPPGLSLDVPEGTGHILVPVEQVRNPLSADAINHYLQEIVLVVVVLLMWGYRRFGSR
jgi:hypothetical protein